MPTPLYDALRRFAAENPLLLNMPGHHGRVSPVENLADISIDFTETPRTGDLLGGSGDAIEAAERLWAERFDFDSCLFLTGGSTQGNHTGLALLAGAGGGVAVDRGSHRSVFHAMALLDLTPHYLSRPWMPEEGICGAMDPEEVDALLTQHPEINTVCITSPTYYGVISDIPAIARVCHAHGAKLMVDGAHGAHLPFLGYEGFSAADVVVMSAHKTLPALGQTALLFANGYDMDALRRMGSVFGSSSPSYLMMASLDVAREWMETEGREAYTQAADIVENFRGVFPAVCPGRLTLDPTRLVIRCGDGFAAEEQLLRRGICPEMADSGHVVFIFTGADGGKEGGRLAAALKEVFSVIPAVEGSRLPPPPLWPERMLSLRQAFFSAAERLPLGESEGRISAGHLAPYPPGIPVIAPGERIEKKHLAYLRRIGYNTEEAEVLVVV